MKLLVSGSLVALLAGAVIASSNCSGDCPNCPGQLAAVVVSPGTSAVLPGRTVQLAALALDSKNHLLSGGSVSWNSLDQGTATVDGSGLVSGQAEGTARIVATIGGKADTGNVTVTSTPGFAQQVYPILATTCGTAFCHVSPGPPPNMSTAASAFTALTAPAGGYLTAGDTTVGKLIHRIRGDTAPMPPGGALKNLQPGNYDLITLWIQQGAQNN